MNIGKFVFSQLVDFLPADHFKWLVRKYDGNKHVKPWLDITVPDGKHYWHYVALSGFPNPKRDRALDRYRWPIRKAKMRYYVNLYIHPFVPDLLEIVAKDIYYLCKAVALLFRPQQFRRYRIERWRAKYGL